jgi:hypothetical protein
MNLYTAARFIHIAAASVTLGAIVCLPVLLSASTRRLLDAPLEQALERLVGAGGWGLVLSGVSLLYLRNWSNVTASWFIGAIVLLLVTLVAEKLLERHRGASGSPGGPAWAQVRTGLFTAILALMVFKP